MKARIVVALGCLFPMIRAHKVLAAYACLAPRLVSGRFDPTSQRAVWPSTGNYCRGGVAISKILGCRGVAVLPDGMSRERFDWLSQWVSAPDDIVRTPGTESNVKEIYDACAALARDPANDIVNQFSEFGNYLGHWRCTGPALETVFSSLRRTQDLTLAGFVSASGSAGTLAAGDYLKAKHGTKIAVVEAVECPTLLMNGYGEHNIQGIGDKHVPLIHNVMNTDLVIGVSDQATDGLNAVFNTDVGRDYLARRLGVAPTRLAALDRFGPLLDRQRAGRHQDGQAPRPRTRRRHRHRGDRRPRDVRERACPLPPAPPQQRRADPRGGRRDRRPAPARRRHRARARCHASASGSASSIWAISPGWSSRASRSPTSTGADRQDFWRGLQDLVPQWDEMIAAFNRDSGMAAAA